VIGRYDGIEHRAWLLPMAAGLALVVAMAAFLVMPNHDEEAQGAPPPQPSATIPAEHAHSTQPRTPATTVTVTATPPPTARRTVTARPAPTATVTLRVPGLTLWRHTTPRVREVPVPGPTVSRTITLPPAPAATRTVPGPTMTVTRPGPTMTVTATPPPPAQPHAEAPTPRPEPSSDPTPPPDPDPPVYRVASYNVLGHSHTAPGGTRASWAAGTARITWVIRLLRRHRIDLVGLQELQRPQWRVLRQRAGEYRVWPGPGDQRDTDNAVAWRHSMWRLVQARTVGIPYFHGKIRQMPVLLLQHRATGQRIWIANFHNPASLPWLGSQRRHRQEALHRQAELANRLQQDGHPVIVTGDMNDTRWYFCPFVRATRMHAANGGHVTRSRCRLPENLGIDWIFGTTDIRFTGYSHARGPLAQHTSDHPMILATARARSSPPATRRAGPAHRRSAGRRGRRTPTQPVAGCGREGVPRNRQHRGVCTHTSS
jgi:endonuclease/exonuclease/phosphatase family metal-dependent hydrolase